MTAILNSVYVATATHESIKTDGPATSSAMMNFLGDRFTLHVSWLERENQFLCIRFNPEDGINHGFLTVGSDLTNVLVSILPELTIESASMIADLLMTGDDGTVLDILAKLEKRK